MQSQPNLGEQALSKAAEVGISSQLDEVEELNVDIRTEPLQIIQGKVDSVSISGEGMVMKQDLRMESLEIRTGTVAVNPASVVFGKIELTQPTNADTQIVLTEDDINRAFNSTYLGEKLQNLVIQVDQKAITVDIQQAEMHLLSNGNIELQATILLEDTNENKQFKAVATPQVQDHGQRIGLEIHSTEGQNLSPELTDALCDQLMQLLDLRNFDLQGMSLQLRDLRVEEKRLTLLLNTTIVEFPSA